MFEVKSSLVGASPQFKLLSALHCANLLSLPQVRESQQSKEAHYLTHMGNVYSFPLRPTHTHGEKDTEEFIKSFFLTTQPALTLKSLLINVAESLSRTTGYYTHSVQHSFFRAGWALQCRLGPACPHDNLSRGAEKTNTETTFASQPLEAPPGKENYET